MYIDFASDWPAYFFMLVFFAFIIYVIAKGHVKVVNGDAVNEKIVETKKNK